MASAAAARFIREQVSERVAQAHRQRRRDDLPARLEFVHRGFDFQAAELAAARARLSAMVRAGDPRAQGELAKVKERQRSGAASRDHRLAQLRAEPDLIEAGAIEFLVHALVVPAEDSKETERYDADVEAIAVEVAADYENRLGAQVQDVSRPELARRAGLTDWPGFDLLSHRAGEERRAIEVKGRAGTGPVEMSENEWAKACSPRRILALRRLQLRHASPAFGAGARPVCQAARQEPRVYRLHHHSGAVIEAAE